MELVSLNCASCGAALEDFEGKEHVKCDFCDNTTQIIRPIKVSSNNDVLSSTDSDKFQNLISIMERSMVAGNYKEGYDYCNKALELDPNSAPLWENKAICSFWIRSDSEIIGSEAKEILTYLKASKQANPDSETYESTAKAIASNLYYAVYYKYLLMRCDASSDGKTLDTFSETSVKILIKYLSLMELCFDIYPNKYYLDAAVTELTNLEKLTWIEKNKKGLHNLDFLAGYSFDAVKTREKYIKKIKKVDPSYKEPEFEDTGWCFIATATMGSYNHPSVLELRSFRDEWILEKFWGETFVKLYYKIGPYFAALIKESRTLKKVSYVTIVKPLTTLSSYLRNK